MAYNTIIVKGDPLRKELRAAGAITPGDLLRYASTTTVATHNVSGGTAFPLFALEAGYIGDTISTDYAAGDQVPFVHARRGDELYVNVASGENIAAFDPLESNGLGQLKEYTVQTLDVGATETIDETIYTNTIVGFALEAPGSLSAETKVLIAVN